MGDGSSLYSHYKWLKIQRQRGLSLFYGLYGHVTKVAPDTSIDEKGEPYFRIFVQTDKTYLGDDQDLYKITPGMQATVIIHTGLEAEA